VNDLVQLEINRQRSRTRSEIPPQNSSHLTIEIPDIETEMEDDAKDEDYQPHSRAGTRGTEPFTERLVDWFKNSPDPNEDRIPTHILHPESHGKTGWDIFTGVQVVIVCFLLPFELCFMDSQSVPTPLWWTILEIVMTYIFMFDVLVNFFTAFRVSAYSHLVVSLRLIAFRYLKTWFAPDLIAAFPYYLFDPTSPGHGRGNNFTLSKLTRFARFFRLFRLARILRLLKLPRLLTLLRRMEQRFNVHPGLSRMNRILLSVIFGVHFAACLWFLIGRSIQYCGMPDPWPVATMAEMSCSWISQSGFVYGFHLNETISLQRQYVSSFYYCLTTLATVGYGDISGKTYAEQIFAMVLMIFGVVWYSFVLSSTASIILSFQGHDTLMREKLRDTNLFLREAKIPNRLAARVRKHFKNLAGKKNAFLNTQNYDTQNIISGLSNQLKTEVVIHIQRRVIARVPFLRERSHMFQASVVVHLQSIVIGINEPIIQEGLFCNNLQFLTKGQAISTVEGKYFGVYDEGEVIGESGLLTDGIQNMSVFAFTLCHLEILPHQVFYNLSVHYSTEMDELMLSATQEYQLVQDFRNASAEDRKRIRKHRTISNLKEDNLWQQFTEEKPKSFKKSVKFISELFLPLKSMRDTSRTASTGRESLRSVGESERSTVPSPNVKGSAHQEKRTSLQENRQEFIPNTYSHDRRASDPAPWSCKHSIATSTITVLGAEKERSKFKLPGQKAFVEKKRSLAVKKTSPKQVVNPKRRRINVLPDDLVQHMVHIIEQKVQALIDVNKYTFLTISARAQDSEASGD